MLSSTELIKCSSIYLDLFYSSTIVSHYLQNLLLQMLFCFSPSLPVFTHCLPFSLESSSTNAPLLLSISSSLQPLSPILSRIFYKCSSVSLHLFQSSAIVCHSLQNLLLQMLLCFSPSLPVFCHYLFSSFSKKIAPLFLSISSWDARGGHIFVKKKTC